MGRLCILGLLVLSCWVAQPSSAAAQTSHLRRLFDAVDKNQDGQLLEQELRQFIGGLESTEYSSSKLDKAVEGAMGRLASSGQGVDWTELEQHSVLQDVKVADWVAHGLGMPQYAEAFRSNSITALDLPMLVDDGGQLLQTELKVTSPLHRQQLLRAMQRQLLGLGSPPGRLSHLHCKAQHAAAVLEPAAASAAASADASADHQQQQTGNNAPTGAAAAVLCSWKPPADAGQPGMHKYVLQRIELSAAATAWQTVAELHDSLSVRFRDTPPTPGVYQYRLSAWNVYGRSPYVLSEEVTVSLVQQAAEGVVAAGAATAVAVGVPADVHRASGQAAGHKHSAGSQRACSQQGEASCERQQEEAGVAGQEPGSFDPDHQSPSEGAMWLSGLGSQHDAQHNIPAGGAGRAAQGLTASIHAAAAAVASQHTGAAATNSNSSKKQATTAGLAALLGSAWQSSMGPWLKAFVNSFLLLVLPICVRLLPLHVLAKAAQLLAWVLQFLPSPVREQIMLRQPSLAGLPLLTPSMEAKLMGVGSSTSNLGGSARSGGSVSGSGRRLARHTRSKSQSSMQLSPAGFQLTAANATSAAALSSFAAAARGQDATVPTGTTGGPAALRLDGSVRGLPVSGSTAAGGAGGGGLWVDSPASPFHQQAAAPSPARGLRRVPRSVSELDLSRSGLAAAICAPRPKSSAGSTSSNRSLLTAAGVRFCSAGGGGTSGAGVGAAVDSPVGSQTHARPNSASAVMGAGQLMAAAAAAAHASSGGTGGAGAAGFRQAGAGLGAGCRSAEQALLPGQALSSGSSLVGSPPAWGSSSSTTLHPGELFHDLRSPVDSAVLEVDESELEYMLHGSRHSDTKPSNKCCSFPGCQQQFGLRQWKATLQRHYCGRCQQAFCMQHTAYSPHGSSGTCGVQSRCLCIDCFYEYTPEYQSFLASRNTLVGKRSKSGPPGPAPFLQSAGASADAGAASYCEGGSVRGGSSSRTGRMLSRLVPSSLHSGGGSTSRHGSPAARWQHEQQQEVVQEVDQEVDQDLFTHQTGLQMRCEAAAEPAGDATAENCWSFVQQQQQQQEEEDHQPEQALRSPLARQRSLGAGAVAPSAACDKGLKSRMLWGRGMTKALGVVRFKQAGGDHVVQQQQQQQHPSSGSSPFAGHSALQ